MERRKHHRRRAFATQSELTIHLGTDTFAAKLVDVSEEGFGLEMDRPLEVGCRIRLTGEVAHWTGLKKVEAQYLVRWCVEPAPGKYSCGVMLDRSSEPREFPTSEPDYYEVMQLSANADLETVHRVFRILAQRFHPDNKETGDEDTFKALVKAYEVLRDPTERAAYDAQRPAQQQQRMRIFTGADSAQGPEAERRKRKGILSLLYNRRANEPRQPGMTLVEFEQLLGCPREHLQFALWFLRETGCVTRGDNGKFTITAKGVAHAEMPDLSWLKNRRMIEAPPATGM